MKSSVIIGGSGKTERHESDFYPTPPEVTQALVDFLKLPKNIRIWEPACGTGDMSKILENNGYEVFSSDIIDTGYGEVADYLTTKSEYDTIITNPPFSLAQQFIEKAIQEADLVCMLLKSTYWQAKSRLELFRKSRPAYILPLTWRPQFCPERGTAPTMDFQWTVWNRSNIQECRYVPLERPE